jgi:hypothetical protein
MRANEAGTYLPFVVRQIERQTLIKEFLSALQQCRRIEAGAGSQVQSSETSVLLTLTSS